MPSGSNISTQTRTLLREHTYQYHGNDWDVVEAGEATTEVIQTGCHNLQERGYADGECGKEPTNSLSIFNGFFFRQIRIKDWLINVYHKYGRSSI